MRDGIANDPAVIAEFLTDFISRQLSLAGFRRLVAGVSGGVDSAVVCFLAVKAIGKDNVVGVVMPYRLSSKENMADAEGLIALLGIKKHVVDISVPVDHYFQKFPEADRVRRGNKMARERMSVLYDISALEKALVVGTSNKSEILLGYGTIFGDLACALNPIGDLYKTQVRELARFLGVPEGIIAKKPSADLYAGQSDEGELGFSYEQVDELLYLLFEKRISHAECEKKGFDRGMIEHVMHLYNNNRFKGSPPVTARIADLREKPDSRITPDGGK